MTAPRNKNLLFNWIFFAGSVLLALNDHYLKSSFPGALTGKLSDIVGLLIFPLFLAFVFPRHWKLMPLITGLIFIYWKLPSSSPLIALFDQLAPDHLAITRTIDYTDLWCLLLLPLSYQLIPTIDRYRITVRPHLRLRPVWLLIPASFIFMSTSMKYTRAHKPIGSVWVGESYTIKMKKEDVLDAMRKEGFNPIPDTASQSREGENYYYILENVKFPGAIDSIQSIQFQLYARDNNTDLFVTYIKSAGDIHISDWHLMKMYAKYYRYLIKSRIVKPMK